MASKRKNAGLIVDKRTTLSSGYDGVLKDVVGLLEQARRASARVVNAVMTATYWQIGRRIVEGEQGGMIRAGYGEALLERLSADLTARFGRGFSIRNLRSFRAFYLGWPIRQTPSAELAPEPPQTAIGQSIQTRLPGQVAIPRFPLPWSHYVRLLSVKNDEARRFYETEALRGGWSVKQLDRQVDSLYYERTALSRNKKAMLTKGAKPKPEDAVTPQEEVKDPFVLEFLGLKDEYSETQMEEALVRHLEQFLLELGGDFTFVGRQRRLRIDDQWFRIDLLFFHRKLRCLVIVDLKTGKFTHADAGQMHVYCNYAAEHWTNPGENPPVGLILCAQKGAAVAHYALDNLPNKIMAAEYRMALPNEKTLAQEIDQTRKVLETRTISDHARQKRKR